MKKSSIVPLFAVLALAVVAPAPVSMAGTQPPPQYQNQNQAPRPKKATPTTIQSVNAGSITVKGAKTTKTYTITNLTEVTYNGELAKVSDLKPGMRVVVTVGMDPANADRIAAEAAPKKK